MQKTKNRPREISAVKIRVIQRFGATRCRFRDARAQVEALQGYTNRTTIQSHIFMSVVGYTFYGEKSGWSNTQTIIIGESQTPTPSPATTPTPIPPNTGPTSPPDHEPLLTQEQLKIIVGVSIVVAVTGAGVGLLIYLIKRK
jgi:hypothetical protein